MLTIRRTVKVVGYKRKGRGGADTALFLRLSMYRAQQDFALGIHIPHENFDKATGQVIGHAYAQVYNKVIAQGIASLEGILRHYEVVLERRPTPGELRDAYKKKNLGVMPDRASVSLADLVRMFKADQGAKRSWTEATYDKFDALLNNMQSYDRKAGVEDITEDYLDGLVSWYIRKGYTNTTIAKKLGFLRWFMRWCENGGYYHGNAHRTFRVKLKGANYEQKTIVYLERSELAALESCDLSKSPYLDRVRDLFVFSCYCGLRFSDVIALTRDMITDKQISIVTKKTGDALHIDLNAHTKRILAKYSDTKGRYVFPRISNQKANAYIRKACKTAGIDAPLRLVSFRGSVRTEVVKPKWECMTFHAARRTFITMALLLEIPIPVIMSWSGHKDVKMLKPYMAVVDEMRRREMSKFDAL